VSRFRPSSLRGWFSASSAVRLRAATLGALVAALLLFRWMLLVPESFESQLTLRLAGGPSRRHEQLEQLQALKVSQAGEDADQVEHEVIEVGPDGQVAFICRGPAAPTPRVCLALIERALSAHLVEGPVTAGALTPLRLTLAHPWGIWLTSCAIGALAALLIAFRPRRRPEPTRHAEPTAPEAAAAPKGAATSFHDFGSSAAQLQSLVGQLYLLATAKCLVVGVSSAPAQRVRKNVLAARLATMLSESSAVTVLLLEADFEQPGLHEVIKVSVPPRMGFTQQIHRRAAEGTRGPWAVIRRSNTLSVMAEGLIRMPGMLTSPEFARAVEQLRELYDVIVLSGPPAGRGADARAFADIIDVMVFALEAGRDVGEAVRMVARRLKDKRVAAVVVDPTLETD
jgi:Mrp family chromosome partitioning ATPase